ncbi:MAG: N-acetylmuramoyl-L-alanine amidase [Burkholderiales bacterium]|nr:N-acetylmuramoyl-L-alanine amidase [Phycisphaerae bacterium]
MARIAVLFSMIAIATGLAGCQSLEQVRAPLPQPNFAGPFVEPPTRTALVIPPAPTGKLPGPVQQIKAPPGWTPLATAEKRQWKWIVIHHSATPTGGMRAFDKAHRAKGWDELGYHFVIGNGTDTADGLVEVGGRWPVQKHGAHAKTPDNEYNDHGIGICLVGNFDETRPSAKQVASLSKLIAFLADRYRVSDSRIIGHSMTGKKTDCPGTNMDIKQILRLVARQRSSVADSAPQPDMQLIESAAR